MQSNYSKNHLIKYSKVWLLLTLVTIFALTSCNSQKNSPLTETNFAIDPAFREFLKEYLSDKPFLQIDEPLTAKYVDSSSGYEIQVFKTVVLVRDPSIRGEKNIWFEPVAQKFNGIEQPAVPRPTSSNKLYINGHVIDDYFIDFYKKLGGTQIVGDPLTEAYFDPSTERLIQYFENMGFYKRLTGVDTTPHLLEYGYYKCFYISDCPNSNGNEITIIEPTSNNLSNPFLNDYKRLGFNFVGKPLTYEFEEDGKRFVIFENLVLWVDPNNPGRVFAHPIVELLNTAIRQMPVDKMDNPQMYFYQSDKVNDKGYNIPNVFMDYIGKHGGLDISGQPITQLASIGEEIFRQCFENLCLEFHSNLSGDLQLRPSPLGIQYQENFYPDKKIQADGMTTTGYTVHVTKSRTLVGEKTPQILTAQVLHNQVPQPKVQPELFLTLPDGQEKVILFDPTDVTGRASLTIPFIPGANSTHIPFKVCITNVCWDDFYVLWETP